MVEARSTATVTPAPTTDLWTWLVQRAKSAATGDAAPSSPWTTAKPPSATEKVQTTAAQSLDTVGPGLTIVTAQSALTIEHLQFREVKNIFGNSKISTVNN